MSGLSKIATVIGGRGFIGRALVTSLRAQDWDCHVPDRDFSWPEMVRPLGHVFYCAGLTADYLRDPRATLEAHAGLLSRVLQSARFESLVYLSSTRLYDGIPTEGQAQEDVRLCVNPVDPRHLYDVSKLAGENLCHVMGQGRARVARLSCVYSHLQDAGGFLPELFKKLANSRVEQDVRVASSPYFSRDYVHVSDVVHALIDISVRGVHTTYNVASGQNLRNDDLAALVQTHSGRKIVFELDRLQSTPPVVNIDRLKSEFGWSPASVSQCIAPWLQSLPSAA